MPWNKEKKTTNLSSAILLVFANVDVTSEAWLHSKSLSQGHPGGKFVTQRFRRALRTEIHAEELSVAHGATLLGILYAIVAVS